MPYIGNTAADRFVASKAASVFSGDGSTTAFTLSYGVGSDEDILVSVDGVIQEPSVAYSVSGTTLTFTAAPSSNAGNNIFVYYLFRTVGTVSHPSSNALEATSGTFSSDVTVSGAFTSQGIDDNATSTAMTIDASQGVTLSSNGDATQLKIKRASASQDNGLSLLDQVDTAQAYFNLEGTSTNNLQIASTAAIQCFSGSTLGDPPTNKRMDITSGGNIGFGVIATSDINSSIAFTATGDGTHSDHFFSFGPHSTANDPSFYTINESGTGVYLGHGNNSWSAHSDERIKENITSLENVLPDIVNIRCVKYNLKGQTDTKIGFIAQDWETNFSEVVDEKSKQVIESDGSLSFEDESESTTAVKALSYTETIPVLLKAIQELKTELDEAKARIEALENS